ncbi:voltage-gated potassium channel [Wallemia mellicola]|uniref:Voltage-gated potassium channel n=1 Tax=Wallemia mellicola TaxID=1708541 RepID=A0AB38MFT9_9BASI|nr:voltage-gated potassium channel [Wallemia mellicola]TIB86830.1 voltage-gated potassium channel [Wallemia mellicola]TIC06383.1 voltage-gated potassium channel [Wallemia mellicola]TIC39753.1 voltage-gated potassium channel [Wallemia mellicola]TIC48042.1 voltage-gated potassium channel [Wallemia mellicola]
MTSNKGKRREHLDDEQLLGHEMQQLNNENDEGEQVSDWSTFWGESDPAESNEIRKPWKKNLYQLLQEPNSSQGAFTIHICITLLIVIAAVLTILETIPSFRATDSRIWFGLETAIVAMFTIEYCARVAAHSDSWVRPSSRQTSSISLYYVHSDFLEYLERLDVGLLSLWLPSSLFADSSKLLLTIEVMVLSFKRSADALFALSFLVCTLVALFATFLYFLERGSWDASLETFITSDGEPSSFDSIPAAAWFVLVTISTVGYGEVTPTTTIGRLITLPLLIFGLLLIALPSFVLGRNFSIVWDTVTSHQNVEATPRRRNYVTVPSSGFGVPSEPEPIFDAHNPYGSPTYATARPRVGIQQNSQLESIPEASTSSAQYNVVDEIKSLRLAIDQQSRDMRILMEALSQRPT